jgi:FHS family L-fucose permease-like MFS transporter
MIFWPFLISYFIITCGLSFLETSANPYILSMGPEETSTRRLNMSQAFNPVGSLLGMFTAQSLILARLNPATREERGAMPTEVLREVTAHDLGIIRGPYVAIALVIIVFFVLIVLTKMPAKADRDRSLNLGPTFKRLLTNKRYIHSVIAQFFYVGVQIMCWTFIIHYGTELFTSPGYDMTVQEAEVLSQKYNIAAMCIFCASRFVCTHLLKFICPGRLLMSLAIGGTALILGTIFVPGIVGLYCLVGASACMSLMFPTIYGIALTGLGDDAKLGAAGLIMAILGGSVMPPVQGAIIDLGTVGPLSAVRASFVVSLICFVVIVHFGRKTYRVYVTS